MPTEPGSGYLKFDVTGMTRFKAAYVSGVYRAPSQRVTPQAIRHQIMPFQTDYVPVPDEPMVPVAESIAGPGPASAPRVFDVAIARLTASGPNAHRVWLPPLAEPPSLDSLLPGLDASDGAGLQAWDWPLRGKLSAPIGIVDRPFEQRRDPFLVDLSGAAGHVGVVGATRSGKSTMLRTLVTSLALTRVRTRCRSP